MYFLQADNFVIYWELDAGGAIATPGPLFHLPFHVTWERWEKTLHVKRFFLIGWDRSHVTPHQYIEKGAHFISYRCAACYYSDLKNYIMILVHITSRSMTAVCAINS